MEQVNLATTYSLLTTREIPIPKIIGALHFITGSDDIPFLQVFTKDNWLKTFDRLCPTVCVETRNVPDKIVKGNKT